MFYPSQERWEGVDATTSAVAVLVEPRGMLGHFRCSPRRRRSSLTGFGDALAKSLGIIEVAE